MVRHRSRSRELLFQPAMLAYVTGGYAYGSSDRFNFNVVQAPGTGLPCWRRILATTTPVGLQARALEYKLDSRWSVKAKYQYLALQNNDALTSVIIFNNGNHGHFSSALDINGIHTAADRLELRPDGA